MKFLASILTLFTIATAAAQLPSTQIDAPPQTSVARDAPLNPALPTLFIVGDSTARNGADLGWGDHFAALFDTSRINIANRAVAGRSSRTYINEGRWARTLAEMKPGDYMLFQMGHNDGGDLGGAKPRGELKGIGNDTQDVPQTAGPLAGTTETVHTYGWYVRKYIAEARARGVTPILLTLTVRNIWTDGHIERDFGYTAYIHQLSEELKVPLADMATLEADYLERLGPEKTAALFPIDHTHTSAAGAAMVARMVAQSLVNIHSPLTAYLKQ
jgi:rhamnogalacturonan acetylesterase